MADDLSSNREIVRLKDRVRRLESTTMLQNSAISEGRMRFIGGLLRVDSGGRVEIEGTLEGGGTFIWTGTLTNNGTLVQNGTWELNGTGEIVGNTLLTGDLTVQGSGKITLGNMVLDPSSNGGSVKFAGGPEVYADDDTLSMYSGALNGAYMDLGPAVGKLNGGGAKWLEVTPDAIRAVGLPTRTGTGLPSGAVGADTDGTLWRAA